jgi:glutamate carboxypeptidase
VIALFTSDEEIGSDTSRPLIEKLALEAKVVFVLEAGMPDGSAKVWRKGVGEYFIKVKGRASHAGGAHAEGCNAIAEMAQHILTISAITDYEKGTTVNVGVIKGGIASNVVPDECNIEVDYRVLDPKETDRVDAVIRGLKPVLEGTSIEIVGGLNRPPMPNDATMQATFARAKEIAASIGIDLTASGTGGGSDANFVAPLGIPVLDGLGPVGEGYHSEREFFHTDTFISRTKLLAALISQWE